MTEGAAQKAGELTVELQKPPGQRDTKRILDPVSYTHLEVIAVRRAIPRLLEMAMNRYPWINRIMTLRRGKLVELRLSALTRLAT